ncbi:hypothetical protein SS1G_12465 [Sclerotinia sclerotiorum 1980 UF-70]|uniref:Oxidase ustYa n=2 Tax=Sclerotinia sclerotiorum (strain ATCC 18683 / 1980 / Ss-1) TaxID=665079 RepID=A7F4E1_SCLS1|nr:hypothetical protein SS1G_12465 [Sclerotinia sclerotiorum 1980 UF-70]APA10681.1 hypothetical protein sscle_06g054510 [Sclerotinia sclerotiorum 1980 UF-70]EDN97612.1 hypothetical protein SS1G_12465 [Sclerotinia sclerotiorum 1980 UF-70]
MENKYKPDTGSHPLRFVLYTIFLSTAIISTFVLLAHKELLPFIAPVQKLVVYQICPEAQGNTAGATIQNLPASDLYPKVFQPIPALEAAIGDAEDVNWDEYLLTPNGGFIMVDEGDGVVKGYGVTMFHQLHCLGMIRTMLFGGDMNHDHEVQGAEWSKNPLHFLHCLDYIAQGIICTADDTLEVPKPTTNAMGKVVDGIDGMGHEHQCRNASALREKVLLSESKPVWRAALGRTSVFSHRAIPVT